VLFWNMAVRDNILWLMSVCVCVFADLIKKYSILLSASGLFCKRASCDS
jgi:hypothetical protein